MALNAQAGEDELEVRASDCGRSLGRLALAWRLRHRLPGRDRTLSADAATAGRHGLRLGLQCSYCCANLMTILLVIGVMDLRAMAVVTAAITVERLAPAGARVARAIGAVVVGQVCF